MCIAGTFRAKSGVKGAESWAQTPQSRLSKRRWIAFEAVIVALVVLFTLLMIIEAGAAMLVFLIAALIMVPFIVRNAKRLKAIKERLTFVEGEIAKLDAALGRGVAEI